MGDAATYTSYYIVSQVFRYQATRSAAAYTNAESGLIALNRLFTASGMPGVPCRYVYSDGRPFVPNPDDRGSFASKDMFTAICYAFNMAIPILRAGPVKEAALTDLRAMVDNFIVHDFAFTGVNPSLGVTQFESFNPGLTLAEFEELARSQPELLPKMVDALAALGAIGNRKTRIGSREYPLVAIGLAFMGVYYRNIADHWDDWRYFYERGMARSEYDCMRVNLTREDYFHDLLANETDASALSPIPADRCEAVRPDPAGFERLRELDHEAYPERLTLFRATRLESLGGPVIIGR